MEKVPTIHVWQGTPVTPMARIYGHDGAAITQASLTSISLSVYDADTGTRITGPTAVEIAWAVFDTLQTGNARWIKAGGDATGYNFAHLIGAASFPLGEKVYSVEYTFTPSSGDPFFLICTVRTKMRPSSTS